MVKSSLLYFVFFLTCLTCFSQSKIDGHLKSEKNENISGATIILYDIETNNILKYDISDENGYFNISIYESTSKFKLNIRSIGFKEVAKIIDNKTQTFDFTLTEEVTELKEVKLKSYPISKRGDTINYSVKSFSKQNDRTIGDVLKNMPGIEVLDNGKILYQGKPINKYYIEGLDLLEGKYNLANKNLPHKEVTKVQILENHQPVKILDSLVYSDKAALNIKLKKAYTFTGQAELGAGFSPGLWDVNVTPMLFSKKRQMLSSYQANNSGNNVATQLKTLTIEDLLEQFESNDEKQDWLSIQHLNTPNFSEKRWIDNNVHLASINYLEKLKKDYELRLNLSYLNDYQQQNGFTNTQYFTANDTIVLFENKFNQHYINNLETNLTLQKNTSDNYFKNSLKFSGFWNGERGNIQLTDGNINQKLSNEYFKLSNDLKTLFVLGKQIATLKSYIGINKTPQTLVVKPGQFNGILNNGETFDELTQDIELNTFYTNNNIGITKGWKHFSFSPKIGFQFEKQDLESQILTSNLNQNNTFENNLDWTRSKFYFKMKTQYKYNNWRMEMSTPVYYHNYQIEDEFLQRKERLNRVTFEPRASISYELNSFWRLNSSANLSNQFGNINQIYFNYILTNYRNLQRIDAPLPEIQNFNYSSSLQYRNPIKALFLRLSYGKTITENNLLYNNNILNNGAIELQAIEQNNNRYIDNFSARISKYFSKFNTNLTFNTIYSLIDLKQILNNQITDISNQNLTISGKIDTDITDWFNTELESVFQFSNNEIQNRENQTITQQSHKFNLNIYPKDNQYVALKNEYIRNDLFSENTSNIFTDFLYRLTWQKKDIDFEIQLSNIFNAKNYRTINIDEFSYIESSFRLRPRQVLFKIRFSL
ncbi:hypothetical protein [Psychroflexus sp. MBR-150]